MDAVASISRVATEVTTRSRLRGKASSDVGHMSVLGARSNQGAVALRLPLPMHTDAHGRAQSFAWLIWSARGSSRNSTGISEANRISCDPAAAQLDSAIVAARRCPARRVISALSDNSYACWSTRTGNPGTLDTLPSAPPNQRSPAPNTADAAGECTIRDSKCPSQSRQNVGSHRRQRSAVYAAPRVLAEQAVRQLTIIEGNVTPGRPAVSQGAHAQNRRHP